MPDYETIAVERHGRVEVIRFNRPEAMNSFNPTMTREWVDALEAADSDPDVGVIVSTGTGRAYSAGADMGGFARRQEAGGPDPASQAAPPRRGAFDPHYLAACKPIIGAINGVAITGGFEVALACDVLICSEHARFADTHARVGITPGWGLSQKLSRAIGPYRAKELSLTGNFLDAKTAYDWGLVNRVVPAAELMPTALKLAAEMASIEADMLVTYKAMIDDGYALAMGEGLELEHSRSLAHNAAVTPEMVADRRAAVQARGRSQ